MACLAADSSALFCTRSQPLAAMQKAELHHHLGPENICASVQAALDRAAVIVAG